jgi:hypothetical protein
MGIMEKNLIVNYQDTLVNYLRIHAKLLVGEADALDLPSTQGSPVIL